MSAINYFSILVFALMQLNCSPPTATNETSANFTWESFPPIPDTTGFAGSFAGIVNNVLLVAGGANFPNGGTPWNGGKKTWYRTVFAFDQSKQAWVDAGELAAPLGYGVSISTDEGLILIGGSNESGHTAAVTRLQFINGAIKLDSLPALPETLANACGALVDQTIYVAGGLHTPESKETNNSFYYLNLHEIADGWQKGPSWPGPSRMLAVAGATQQAFYLFSGTELVNGERVYLKDGYVYTAEQGWTQLPDLPKPVVAAPSPAWYKENSGFYIFGGDDGALATQAAILKEQHPGFSKDILLYNIDSARWQQRGMLSATAPVTTTMVNWNGKILFPGGEVRPGVRTPQVLAATPVTSR